jgi:hypothetical protein
VIPLEAVVRRGGVDFVYVVEDGAARNGPCAGPQFSVNRRRVLEGLSAETRYVVRGQNLIRVRSRVTVSAGSR